MDTYDQIRGRVADIIAEERECGTMPGSASLAGLTDDEWTADRILKALTPEELAWLTDQAFVNRAFPSA